MCKFSANGAGLLDGPVCGPNPETTRATVSATTDAAPALLQCSRTGIQRRSCRHYIIYQQNSKLVNSQAFSRGVGATYGFPVFFARKDQPGRARLRAHQQIRTVFDAEFLRQGARDQIGLVVTSFPLARGMKRDRNNHVGAEFVRLAGDKLRKPFREPVAQPGHLFVLH